MEPSNIEGVEPNRFFRTPDGVVAVMVPDVDYAISDIPEEFYVPEIHDGVSTLQEAIEKQFKVMGWEEVDEEVFVKSREEKIAEVERQRTTQSGLFNRLTAGAMKRFMDGDRSGMPDDIRKELEGQGIEFPKLDDGDDDDDGDVKGDSRSETGEENGK